jgi:hypothetical protein
MRRAAIVGAVLIACAAFAPAASAYGPVGTFGGAGTELGKFTDLRDVATDTRDNVFTAERGRIQKFDPHRAVVASVIGDPSDDYASIAVDGYGDTGTVYVVDRAHGLRRYRASDLQAQGTVSFTGQPSNWAKPRAIAIDALHNLYVTFPNDTAEAGKISGVGQFSPSGSFIRSIGTYDPVDGGNGDTSFVNPVDIAVDDVIGTDSMVWVADPTKDRLYGYQPRPTVIDETHTTQRSDGFFRGSGTPDWEPHAVGVMPLDPIRGFGPDAWPGERKYSLITGDQKPANRPLETWTLGGFYDEVGQRGVAAYELGDVGGIAIDPYQRMYLADTAQQKILQYGNDGEPGPGDPVPPPPPPDYTKTTTTPQPPVDPQTLNTQPIICIGLWSAATCGSLPKPDPVYVCVSYWQDCNGFGGSKPAKPGTIDMSGFPSTFKVTAGCDATKKDPYQSRRAAVRAAGDGTPTPDYVNPDTECILNQYLETDVTKEQLQDNVGRLLWEIDGRTFKAEVAASYAVTIQGLNAVRDSFDTQMGAVIFLGIADFADKAFAQMAKPGIPYDLGAAQLNADKICSDAIDVERRDRTAECKKLVAGFNESLRGQLTVLAFHKHTLFLDVSYEQYKGYIKARIENASKNKKTTRAAVGGAAAAKAKKRDILDKTFVVAAGTVKIPQGGKRTLTLKVPKQMRTVLKRLKKRGVKKVSARLVTNASVVPGIGRTTKQRVTISLVPVKKTKK